MCLLCPPLCLEPFMYFIGESRYFSGVCYCMDSKKSGAIWSTWFTAGTALIHFIIHVYLLVSLHKLDNYFEWNEKWNFLPPGIIPIMYIQLVWIILLFLLAFVLMIGINQGFQGRKYIYGWMWGFGAIRVWETLLGIYILVWLSSHRITDVVFMFPESVFIGAYWMINTIIMIYCMVVVSHYYDECYTEMYGKAKRVQFFKMLSNIRSAALSKSASLFSGATTPRSMFRSRSNFQSEASLASSKRSTLQSTASYGQPYGPPATAPSVSEPPYPEKQPFIQPAGGPGPRPHYSQSSTHYPPPIHQPHQPPYPQKQPRRTQPGPAQPYFPQDARGGSSVSSSGAPPYPRQ